MKKPTQIYRSLLRDAWNVTWQKKSLWVFGIFAGLLYRGSVADVAVSGIKQAGNISSVIEQLLDQSFIGYRYVSQFILHLEQIGPGPLGIFIAIFTLVAIGLVCAGVISQAALMHATGSSHSNPKEIRRFVLPHFWNVLTLNIFAKVLYVLLLVLITLPLLLFFMTHAQITWIAFIHLLLYIPLVIILHILFMLALADLVERNTTVLQSVERALSIFKTHWLSTLEFGLILFFLVLIAGVLFAALLALLSIPFGIIYSASVLSGSTGLFLWTNGLVGILLFALIIAFGGAIVTFQYAAWHLFYTRACHRLHGRNPFAKIWRLLFA